MRPAVRAAAGPVAACLVTAAAAWVVGFAPAGAALAGLLVAAAFAAPALIGRPEAAAWPRSDPPSRAGGWYEVRRLATLLRHASTDPVDYATRLRPRLRRLAEGRLARCDVRWADPAARRLLGGELYDLLDDRERIAASPRPRSAVNVAELLLNRLDELPGRPRTDSGGFR